MDEEQFERLLLSLGERRVGQKQSAMERHAQTVLVALVTLLIGWVGVAIWDMKENQNELITEQRVTANNVKHLTETLNEQSLSYVRQVEFVEFKTHIENRLGQLEQ